ncbi:MAG: methyltransferase domain-containing protein, partial [Planctomycetales bacterium]
MDKRTLTPELMDDPELDRDRHHEALRALAWLNGVTRNAALAWAPLRALARDQGVKELKVLDVATGAGDIPIRLFHRARKAGLKLQIEACDLSEQALEYARENAKRSGAEVRFLQHDVLDGPLPEGYDVVMCSQFMHHLEEPEAASLLRKLREAAGRQVIL